MTPTQALLATISLQASRLALLLDEQREAEKQVASGLLGNANEYRDRADALVAALKKNVEAL